MKVAHLTTVDLSLRYLVFPQLAATRDLGMDTIGISAPGPWVEDLEADGIRHVPLPASTRGMNPIADLKAAAQLWKVLRQERPDILHTHNPKPGVYGPKPLRACSSVLKLTMVVVRPWKFPSQTIIFAWSLATPFFS